MRFQYCSTKEELSIAARIRYLAYREVNAIEANDSKEFLDVYDGYFNSKSCIIFENEEPVASIRASVYSPAENFFKIPSLEVYGRRFMERVSKNIWEWIKLLLNPVGLLQIRQKDRLEIYS